jgi:hypothetical protein
MVNAMAQGWSEDDVRAVRTAIHSADGSALLAALRSRPVRAVLQLAGDGVAAAAAERVPGADAVAAEFLEHLTARGWDGDAELADRLRGSAEGGPAPLLRPLPVDLEELATLLEGDLLYGGGHLDLTTGDCYPQAIEWLEGEADAREDDPDRWLHVPCHGSRPGYRDMELFIETLDDDDLAERLRIAITGRGAFRRFKDVLASGDQAWRDYHRLSDERQRGRARAWLADQGYCPRLP